MKTPGEARDDQLFIKELAKPLYLGNYMHWPREVTSPQKGLRCPYNFWLGYLVSISVCMKSIHSDWKNSLVLKKQGNMEPNETPQTDPKGSEVYKFPTKNSK